MNITRTDTSPILALMLRIERLDAACAVQFKEAVRDQIADVDGPLVLDLEEIKFLDSSGLGAVVAVKKMLGADRPLILAGLQPTVAKVFKLTRMDSVFEIHLDLAGAAAANSG
jgi:anti-sigma B factor antagonist